MTGNDKVDKAKELDKFSFEYGDYLKIYHAEADWRNKISGDVQGTNTNLNQKASNDVLSNNSFEITETGLKLVSNK